MKGASITRVAVDPSNGDGVMSASGETLTTSSIGSRSRLGGRRYLVLALIVVCLFQAVSLRAEAPARGVTHAVLINGGSHPQANYLSHLQLLLEFQRGATPEM